MSLPHFPGRNPEDNDGIPPRPSSNYDSNQPEHVNPENTYDDQSQYIQPAPVRRRGRKAGLVVGASVLSLAVLAGGGFAAASIMHKLNDHDISVALPKSTSAFVEADLNPSPGQKINLASVAGKIKDITGETNYDTSKDPKAMFTDPFFSNLDYNSEVQPWIGDKVAFGAWGDFSKASQSAELGAGSESDASKDVSYVVVYEIKDKTKANEAAKKMKNKTAVYEVNDHYLIIAPNQSALDSYNAEVAKGTLDKNTTFTDDRNLLKGQDDIAVSWVNVSDLHADAALNQYMAHTLGTANKMPDSLNGRMITGLSLNNNSVKVSSKLIGFDTTGYSTEKGLSDVRNLPDNSTFALSVKDGKTPATKIWNTYKEAAGSSSADSMDSELKQLGITLPDDFGALLGTETSVGVSAKEDNKGGFTYRAKDGDGNKIGSIIQKVSSGSNLITTADDNGTAVVKYGEGSTGRLGDSQSFKNVTGDLNNTQAVAFVDINQLIHGRANAVGKDAHPDVNYGAAGLTSTFDPSSKIVSVDINWSF
jgi:hypothetical protein